jgi:EmrB/QacA subfamily drug resistance transporter
LAANVDEAEGARAGRERRRWQALVVLSVGQLMVVLDSTVVNVALPTIERQLHFSPASLAWVVNSYLITFGGLLLLGGRLGDLIGRKRLFLIGLGAFSATSLLCGLAPNAGVLVAARFLQGASAASMSSMVLGSLSPMFPDQRERTRALSVFAAVTMGGAALGLPLGGTLTELLSWHWIFFINVPIGVTALILSVRLLDAHAGLGIRAGADILGALLVTTAPMLVVYALIQTSTTGWGSFQTVALFLVALGLGVIFVIVETRVRTPLIPLRVFKNRNLVSANVVRLLFPMGAFGLNFLGSQFLQHVVGYSPLRTGLAFLPNSLSLAVVSVVAVPYLMRHTGAKPLILTGLVLVAAGLALFTRAPVHADYVVNILPVTLLIGVGLGLIFTPSVGVALSDVAPAEAGLVSGLTNVSVQMGGSIGVALLASTSAARTAHLLAQGVASPQALAAGFHLGFVVAAVCPAIAFVAAAFLLRSRRGGMEADAIARAEALTILE